MLRTFLASLGDDGRKCSRCSNRPNLFGMCDVGSGWRGCCSECNVQWYTCLFNSRLRACNRRFAADCLRAFGLRMPEYPFGLPMPGCLLIRSYLGLSKSALRTAVFFQHKLKTLQLLWLTTPMEWWIESDSEGEEERLRACLTENGHRLFIASNLDALPEMLTEHSPSLLIISGSEYQDQGMQNAIRQTIGTTSIMIRTIKQG